MAWRKRSKTEQLVLAVLDLADELRLAALEAAFPISPEVKKRLAQQARQKPKQCQCSCVHIHNCCGHH